MIIDQLENLGTYVPTLPQLKTVIEVLQSGVLKTQALGNYKTANPSVRYNLFTYQTEKTEADQYEIHRKEIDVQILISGFERMEIAKRTGLEPTTEYIEEKDAFFAKGEKLVSYHAKQESFAIFLPGEPHAPNLVDGVSTTVVKVVFKLLA